MTDFVIWLAETAMVISILVGVILTVRHPLEKLANVRWVYLIWGVPAARLALSFLPEPLRTLPSAIADTMGLPTGFAVDLSWIETLLPPTAVALLLAVWLAGFLWTGYRLCSEQIRAHHWLLTGSEAIDLNHQQILANYCNKMQVFPVINGRFSASISGPVLLGTLNPVLLLPPRFFETTPEPELVVRHELVHYKRRDLWCNLLVAIVRCLFWFVPFLGWAEQRFRDDQEVACDRAVLAQEQNARRRGYVRALIQATGPRLDTAVSFVGPEPVIKRRARAVPTYHCSPVRDLAGACVVAVLAVVGLTFGIDAPATALEWMPALTYPAPLPGPCS